MPEIVLNLHNHTYLSDGHGTYQELAQAASNAGIQVVIVTDHNVLPIGKEGYYKTNKQDILILSGEEIHDQTRNPQKNHLLVFNIGKELSQFASDPRNLLKQVAAVKGLAFIAHPIDLELKAIGEPNISWEDWDISDFTGIELWNGFSEIKSVSRNYLEAAFYALFPGFLAHGPLADTLQLWDSILSKNGKCVAVAGADAHKLPKKLGPFAHAVFPYDYHFRSINNHLVLSDALSGSLEKDKAHIYQALKTGSLFIGYDLPYPTNGFSFKAQGMGSIANMGESIEAKDGITFQIRTPLQCKIVLIHNGIPVQKWKAKQSCTYVTNQPGYYRVEAYLEYLGKRRGWIFSNPIFVK